MNIRIRRPASAKKIEPGQKRGGQVIARDAATGAFVAASALRERTSIFDKVRKRSRETIHRALLRSGMGLRVTPPSGIVLNDADRDRFMDAIENPAEPSEALLAAAKKYGYR